MEKYYELVNIIEKSKHKDEVFAFLEKNFFDFIPLLSTGNSGIHIDSNTLSIPDKKNWHNIKITNKLLMLSPIKRVIQKQFKKIDDIDTGIFKENIGYGLINLSVAYIYAYNSNSLSQKNNIKDSRSIKIGEVLEHPSVVQKNVEKAQMSIKDSTFFRLF